VEEPLQGQYTLEVSSPGIDRPLFSLQDYARFSGRRVKAQTLGPVNETGRRNFSGMLVAVNGDEVVIRVDDGEEFSLPFAQIKQAHLEHGKNIT